MSSHQWTFYGALQESRRFAGRRSTSNFLWKNLGLRLIFWTQEKTNHLNQSKLDGKDIINTSYSVILQKSWNVELWNEKGKLTSSHSWAQEREQSRSKSASSSCLPTGACTPTRRATPEMIEEREFQRAKNFSRETFARSAAGTERHRTCGGKDDGGTMVSDSCDSWLTRVRTHQ